MLKREIRKVGTLILEHMADDQYKTKWLMALTEQDGDTYEWFWGELTTIHQEQRKMTNYWIFKQRNITLERTYHLFKPIFSLLFLSSYLIYICPYTHGKMSTILFPQVSQVLYMGIEEHFPQKTIPLI